MMIEVAVIGNHNQPSVLRKLSYQAKKQELLSGLVQAIEKALPRFVTG